MLNAMERIGAATGEMHLAARPVVDRIGTFLVDAFHHLALFAIGATTVWSAAADFMRMVGQGRASLSDILLLFIYLEIGAMVGIYFKTTRLPVLHLIYIVITALGRVLVEVVGAEHKTGTDVLVVTGSMLILAIAVLVLRFGAHRFPSAGATNDTVSAKTP
jgi:phosphate starvation-inducible membrane PsiE